MAAAVVAWLAVLPAGGAGSLAEAIKAAYLVKFAPFVGWPAVAMQPAQEPFFICVIGGDPFGPDLEQAIAGQRVGGKPVAVRHMPQADRASRCHIAFVSGPQPAVRAALSTLRGSPVLTVTDDSATPGVIDFQILQNRVRFRVDEHSATENGLTISSKLLSLAASVRRE